MIREKIQKYSPKCQVLKVIVSKYRWPCAHTLWISLVWCTEGDFSFFHKSTPALRGLRTFSLYTKKRHLAFKGTSESTLSSSELRVVHRNPLALRLPP